MFSSPELTWTPPSLPPQSGTPCGSFSVQPIPSCPPIVTEVQSSSVVEDFTRGVFCIEKHKQTSQGKWKHTIKDVCPYFSIEFVCTMSSNGDNQPPTLCIRYRANGKQYFANIPYTAVQSGKYHKYMDGISKLPDASNKELNEVIKWAINRCEFKMDLTVAKTQGFSTSQDGTLLFAEAPDIQDLPSNVVPESLRKRRRCHLDPSFDVQDQIIAQFCRICSQSAAMKIAGLYLVASLLLIFFSQDIVSNHAFLNFVVQDRMAEEKLTALLSTNNLTKYAVPELGINANKLEAELNQVRDGVAVVADHCFADESATVRAGTKAIIRANKTGRKVIAAFSDKIGYIANQLEEDCCISIPAADTLCIEDAETVRRCSTQFEAILIEYIIKNQYQIREEVDTWFRLDSYCKPPCMGTAPTNTLKLLEIAERICNVFLEHSILSIYKIFGLVESLCKSTDMNGALDDVIVDEFAHIMSENIKNGTFSVVPKKNRLVVDDTKKPIIVYGERIYIRQELMLEVLSNMKKVRNKRHLVNALKSRNVLNETDGNTHPLDAYDTTGKSIRLYCYDISSHILDADVRETLEDPEAGKYYIRPEQLPDSDFLSLVSRSDGRIAGRQIRYGTSNNNSVAIWGQSGYGKTYLMMQLMKRTAELGHRVVVFDSSNSFSIEALYQAMPKGFADTHIDVYDLARLAIPVNPFRIDRSKSQAAQEATLLGLVCAGISELSDSQSDLLYAAVNDVLTETSPDKPISLENICKMLDNQSSAYRSLMNRLNPLIRPIKQLGMDNRTWREFLTKEITIIRMDTSFTERDNVLFDTLIASLYNAQCEDPTVPLDVFIDEIQCQNLAKGSPIHKILTEGRKVHMSFCSATQDYYSRNTDIGSTMGKADTQIFLKPTLNSTELVAKELRFNRAECEKLDSMVRGDCYIKGSIYEPESDRNIPAILRGRITPL